MRPIIGITSYFVKSYEVDGFRPRGVKGQDMLMSTMDYFKSVEIAGGVPVAIPVIRSPNYIEDITDKIDGLILAGGPDIYPLLYDKSIRIGCKKIVADRDRFELDLLKKTLDKNKPVFGICRGFHMLNIYFGGTLFQDIYSENLTNIAHSGSKATPDEPCHSVYFKKGSLFNSVLGDEINVNSFHHQAIKVIGKGLTAVGWSCEDDLIEAIVHESIDSIFGVQWHPEMMAERNDEQIKILKYFVNLIKSKGEKNEN